MEQYPYQTGQVCMKGMVKMVSKGLPTGMLLINLVFFDTPVALMIEAKQ